jgi:hypothetical protein
MSEDKDKNTNDDSTNPVPFEDFVRQQLAMITQQIRDLRGEMGERFVQLSRQIKHLDQKVDVFIQDQIYMKNEWRELRDSFKPKN